MVVDASSTSELQTLALLGTYVPRRCGIGTFTKDLRDAIVAADDKCQTLVLAMDDVPESYAYPSEVRFQIQTHLRRDYRAAANLLNINQVDVALVQHEYGIYGGADGEHVLDLMRRLRMPVIVTLHTMLTEPSPGQAAVISELAELSDRLVVMSRLAVELLQSVYDVPEAKIAFIPHGIPDLPFVDPAYYKDQFGLEGHTILLTFGLLSPSKGIEVAIQALPQIVAKHPDVVYVILGAIHPHVLKQQGAAYRHTLERLTDSLGVRKHVVFHDRYVSLEELCRYLGAADIYIAPYPNQAQIVSGTLVYAMGAGKALVSTPFWYAEEMLAEERGRLFPFGDADALAATVNELLDNPGPRNAMRKRAYDYSRGMVWREVGRQYVQLAVDVLRARRLQPRPVSFFRAEHAESDSIPECNLDHLHMLTDDTGILQHAVYAVPDRHHGYCTDDNARALVATVMYYDLMKDTSVLKPISTYLAFLHYAFEPRSGRFRNFMSFDRRWLEEVGSEDVHGRSLWALGMSVALAPDEATLAFATRLFCRALETAEHLQAPRAWAFALVGIHAYLRRFSGDTFARRTRATLAIRLYDKFQRNAAENWPWCEDVVTYANAKLPHVLILSGQWLPDAGMVEQGLRSLEWLVRLQLADDGTVSLIGNQGWMQRSGNRARFDQQPIEAMALVEACAEAYRCTQDATWRQRARAFLGWFLGHNETQSVLYDFSTGGCRDGLHANGPNLNEGAESTLAWLIALLTVHQLYGLDITLKATAGREQGGQAASQVVREAGKGESELPAAQAAAPQPVAES